MGLADCGVGRLWELADCGGRWIVGVGGLWGSVDGGG